MAILPILSYRSMICEPFCDYLNVTTPLDNGDLVMRELAPILDAIGATEILPGVFQYAIKGGAFKYSERGKVAIFSASGGFLQTLRDRGLYPDYLAALSCFPHRVSMLHVTMDFLVDAPAVIQEAKRLGQSGSVALTRKHIASKDVHALLSLNADGFETGTVYLGNRRNADVWAKVYDKRHERLSRGYDDPGSIVRVEIAVQSDIGSTLRDAFNPRDIFYKFASPSLVEAPADIPEWSSNGEGFVLDGPRSEFTFEQRLKSVLEGSLDVSRLLKIATEGFGHDAPMVLSKLLGQRFAMVAKFESMGGYPVPV